MPHLLLLEDDQDIRLGMEQHLQREGFTVNAFENGKDALRHLQQTSNGQSPKLDVALLDLSLPDMDGLDVLRTIRNTPALRNNGVSALYEAPDGQVRVRYRPNNVRAHRELVKRMKRILHRLGFWKVMTYSHQVRNTTHQCGTLVFGTDPRTSVLDRFCRTHDVENLFVVDASFFPSSAAVNPGLTIVAMALRSADHIKTTMLNT